MNRLPESSIRLISSTQVITSVYSVIKELLENSLDAGATSFEIKLDNYGLDKIEVRDNGCGIHKADIPVFAKRHFTSKITSLADLESLTTYGFRGEALVSEVTVTTKTAVDDISLTYALNSQGEIVSTLPSHLGQGTTVCIKGLFKNLPVRKQYHSIVKRKKEDLKNVENLMIAYGIILPKVRFSLRHNKDLVWQKAILDNTVAVLRSIVGKEVMDQMEWKKKVVEDPEIELELCVPKPGSDVSMLSHSTRDRSFLFINNRPVIMKDIDKLIRQYYNNCHACEMSRHPVCYLKITVSAKDLDVNIDANKTTVMTAHMGSILEQLEEMLVYVYGPLDQAPSWRYRTAAEKDKLTTTTESDLEMSCQSDSDKQSSDTRDRVRNAEPVSTAPVKANQKLHSGQKQHDHLTTHYNGASSDYNENKVESRNTKESAIIVAGLNLRQCETDCANNNMQVPQERQLLQTVMDLDLDSHILNEVTNTFSKENLENNICSNRSVQDSRSCNNRSSATSADGSIDCSAASNTCETSKEVTARTGNQLYSASAFPYEKSKVGMEDELGSEKRENNVTRSSSWNLGTSIKSVDGAVIQPVHLLASSSAQLPGKRPLSPSGNQQSSKQSSPPDKRCRCWTDGKTLYEAVVCQYAEHVLQCLRYQDQTLCPAKSTAYDMISDVAVKRPLSAKDFFIKENRTSVVEQNPSSDYDEVTAILTKMWNELAEEKRISFREKCWLDTQRYNREVAAANRSPGKMIAKAKSKMKLMSVRDMVAAASTQPSTKASGKKKVSQEAAETKVPFSVTVLKKSLNAITPASSQLSFPEIKVLACLPSCKAWICGRAAELCVLNIHRLSEAILFHHLLSQHHLSVHHCATVALNPSNTGGCWSVLEKLAKDHLTLDTFTYTLSESRIAANGFDIKCRKDADGSLCADLVGLCGDVPTYGLNDLVEVLQLLHNNMSLPLAQCRPLKVINFLKSEAVRMVRQNTGEKTMEDVQELLSEGTSFLPLDCCTCLHDRPFFHTLLLDIVPVTLSQDQSNNVREGY